MNQQQSDSNVECANVHSAFNSEALTNSSDIKTMGAKERMIAELLSLVQGWMTGKDSNVIDRIEVSPDRISVSFKTQHSEGRCSASSVMPQGINTSPLVPTNGYPAFASDVPQNFISSPINQANSNLAVAAAPDDSQNSIPYFYDIVDGDIAKVVADFNKIVKDMPQEDVVQVFESIAEDVVRMLKNSVIDDLSETYIKDQVSRVPGEFDRQNVRIPAEAEYMTELLKLFRDMEFRSKSEIRSQVIAIWAKIEDKLKSLEVRSSDASKVFYMRNPSLIVNMSPSNQKTFDQVIRKNASLKEFRNQLIGFTCEDFEVNDPFRLNFLIHRIVRNMRVYKCSEESIAEFEREAKRFVSDEHFKNSDGDFRRVCVICILYICGCNHEQVSKVIGLSTVWVSQIITENPYYIQYLECKMREFKCSEEAISQLKRKANQSFMNSEFTRDNAIFIMFDCGLSQGKIANIVGLSPTWISNIITNHPRYIDLLVRKMNENGCSEESISRFAENARRIKALNSEEFTRDSAVRIMYDCGCSREEMSGAIWLPQKKIDRIITSYKEKKAAQGTQP